MVFSALAHEARRRVLVVLLGRHGEMTVEQIVERFRCSWPTMTRHLSILEEAGMIRVEKVGRERHYVLNRQKGLSAIKGFNDNALGENSNSYDSGVSLVPVSALGLIA